jgi:TonB-linked SusC/RagA family outer membrane protein
MAVAIVTASLNANAQSTLTDYNRQIDLGMGVTQSQLLSTAASQTISGDELQKTAAISLKDALYGRLLGLTALKNGRFSGEDGYGANMNVRGAQTTSENNMLILVDGIKRSIDYITVDEVESVTVLRDAAAVALWGDEGVNGAILVKTKRGNDQNNSIKVSYDHKFTFNPKVADFVDAYTYANAINKARANDGLTPMYNTFELKAFADNSHPYYYPNVNWKKEMFKNTGSEDQLNLSMSGGNERLKYFTMLDYTDAKGLLNQTEHDLFSSQLKFSKANIRTNLDIQLTPSTEMQVNALGSFIETNRPANAGGDALTAMLYQTPASAFPVMNDPDGELADIWGGTTTYGMNNVAAQIRTTGFLKSHARLFQGDFTLKQDLSEWLSGLSASVRFGYNNFSEIYEQNVMGFSYGYQRYQFDADGQPAGLTSYKAGDKTDNLNFSRYINQHNRSSYLAVTADYAASFRDDDHFKATLIWHQSNETRDGRYVTYNRMNWIANLHYDLKQKYVADAVLAMNGSNRSYPQKWSFAPTVSLGYIYADDAEAGLLNFGKVRLSSGIQHIDYVPLEGLWLENYNGGGGDYIFGAGAGQQVWGTFIGYQPTRNFKLETAYKFNIGTDLRFAKTWDVNIDAYYQYRDNILLSGDGLNSSVMGIPSAYVNWGRVASYGVELGVNRVVNVTEDFSYNVGILITCGRNRILRTIENVAYDYLSAEGARVNQAWGLEAVGFFKDEADIANSARQEFDVTRPGDLKYKDRNGDNIINENDVMKMGYDTSVPELNGSLNIGAGFKNFGFNILLQGAGMYTQYLGTAGVWTPMIDGANLSKEYYDNSWDMSDNPVYPRLTSLANNNNYRANSVWFKDVNFLKLRNCEIYYFLPTSWSGKAKMSQCKLFVKGENLFTLSNLKAMDPENIGANYPTLTGVNIGLSVKF